MTNLEIKKQKLPSWDLTDLYPTIDSPEVEKDLLNVDQMTKNFRRSYRGKISKLKEKGFKKLFRDWEYLERKSGRLLSFAQLMHCQITTCQDRIKFLSDVQEKLTKFNSRTLFLPLEINEMSDKHYKKIVSKESCLNRYKIFFDKTRAMKPYQLSEELENLLNDYASASRNAWSKLFDETISEINIEMSGKEYALEETLNLFQSPNSRIRESAGIQLAKRFQEKLKIFGRITNSLAKEKQIEDNWRKFKTPAQSRHLLNDINPKIIMNLRDSVVESYSETSHKYYQLKAKLMGGGKLKIWDRNAPFKGGKRTRISWDQAKHLVLESYTDFNPKMGEIAKEFFEHGWIDAGISSGKTPGAFSHPTVTDVHPYILLNYFGNIRDVMTLSHEIGHGIHQVLASKQGEILSTTPLTLAETASVFGEMLTFERILKEEKSQTQRKYLLAGKIEDIINTVVRQISFYDFECRVHDQRKNGELTTDSISRIWMDISKESLGDCFDYDSRYQNFWVYVPHFIHSPFYVYAYAFGDGMVNALYSTYQSGMPGFQDKYLAMLSAGGSKNYNELLSPFGLDITKKNFWVKGINVLKNLIDELESLS
jgi:oligoendopeptidase F